MSSKLIKGKSRYTKRRLTIIFILCTIIAVSLMTGFSGLNSDNTKHSAIGQRICMYDDVPTDGTTPEDHDLISNVKYAAQKLYTSKYFRGYTSGKVEAELGAGLSYNQNVYNTRVVKGDKIFTESISSSWAKSVGEQKYIDGTRVLYRPSVKVDGSTAKFADSVKDISKEYGNLYGLIPNELTKQVLSVTVDPDKPYDVTIKSVSDDNAIGSKGAANSDAGDDDDEPDEPYEAIDFYNPSSLTPDSDGNFKVTLNLDPVSATLYSRNETRTLAGSSQNPDYSSASKGSVVVTIVIDKEWYPISVNVRETYGIEIPGIGALICNSNLTETFSEFGNKDIVLPEQEFFESHMENLGGGDIPPTEPEAADYLMYAFGKYLSGENLDLSANISIGDVDIKNVKLSVNIGTMNIRAKYDDLYLEYAKGDAVGKPDEDLVYITLNDIKGYLPVAKATGLIDDHAIKSLMSLFASDIALPDFGSILGDDFMSSMTCEKTDRYIYINIPLELDGLAKINAKMTLKNNDTYDLVGITGTVEAFGKTIDINIKTAKSLEFETPDSSYVDLSPVVDFIPAAISTILDNTAYGIVGKINANGTNVSLDAYVERDGFNTVAADATVSVFDTDVSLQYVNDTLYATIGNIGVKATSADIPALISEITKYIGTDTSTLDKVKVLLPQTIGDWISVLKTLTVDEHEIALGMRILGAPIDITLSRNGNLLTGMTLKCNVDMLGIKFDCDVAIDLTIPDRRDIAVADIEYIDAKEITALIPCILDYASAKAFDAQIGGKITIDDVDVSLDGIRLGVDVSNGTTISAIGRLTALDQSLDIAYVDDTAYISLGNIKLKLAAADIDSFVPHIERLLKALGIELNVGTPDTETIADIIPTILDAIESVTLENKTLVLKCALGGGKLTVTANFAAGAIAISGELGNVKLDLGGSLKAVEPEEIDITVEAPETYCDAAEFVPTVEALADFIEARAVSAKFDVSYGALTIGGALAIDLNSGLKFSLAINKIIGYDLPNITLNLTVIDKTAYIKIGGNIDVALTASLADARALLESLETVIPSELYETIENVLNALNDPDVAIETLFENNGEINIEDIRLILDKVLPAINLTVAEGNIDLGVTLEDIALTANVKTDLTAASLDTAIGTTELSVRLYEISDGTAVSIPDGDYVSIAEFIPVIDAIIPVVNAEGFEIDVDVVLFGVNVSAAVTISLPTDGQSLAVDVAAMIGDVPLGIAYKDDVVYLNINDGEIMLKCGTTTAELDALLEELTKAIPALKDILDGLTSSEATDALSLENLVNIKIALAHTENGFAITADLTPAGIDAAFVLGFGFNDNKLSGITLDVTALTSDDDENDLSIDIDLTVELDEAGALRSIRTIEDADYPVAIEIKSLAAQKVIVGNADGYISVADFTDFIAPIAKLLDNISAVKSLTFGIDAYVLTDDMQQLSISGMVEIDLDTTAIRVSLDMLGEKIYITYVSNVLYIKLGTMQLKFTISNDKEKSDIARIYAILDEYLPRYLSEELGVLLGITDGETSSLNDIGLIVDRFSGLGSAQTITDKAALLFGKLHDYDGAKSAIKTLADMINLYMKSGTPTIGFALSKDMVIDITPYLTADKSKLAEISVDTAIAGMTVHASIAAPTLEGTARGIAAPEHSDDYVSIVDYVELINNIVHTFTTTNEDGDITFVIDTFDFKYKENDTTVVNEDGTTTTTIGNTVTVGSVTDENGDALPVLKGKFVKNGSSYDVNLEAHLTLSGISENTGDITLAVYVLTNYTDEASGVLYDKVAFISYKEAKTGYGENVSIDYGSVMQILASALKILGVKPATLEKIIPQEYRVDINSDVFSYMDIVGLDSIRGMIDDLVKIVINAEDAIKDVSAAWKLITAPDNMENATREDKINALLGSTDDIKAYIASAIGRFASENTDATPSEPSTDITEIEVPEFSDIVNGITLTSVDGELGADISNALTTGGDGMAKILASQGVNAKGKGILNGVSIENLDVNTALINADINFTAGGKVEIAPDMNALINVSDEANNTTYSDFSYVKHLLFDVLNTANMMEFEIGGFERDTGDRIKNANNISDKITLKLHIGSLDLVTVDIFYDVKVMILDKQERIDMGLLTEEQANDVNEPKLKTAAIVELKFQDGKALGDYVVGDLTTRLYFYDNVLYVDGVKSWKQNEISYGGFYGIGATKMSFFTCERVYAKYTIDEFLFMLSADGDIEEFMYHFLFYLVPLNTNFKAIGFIPVNLQSSIADSVKSDNATTATPTIATVFKGYTYYAEETKIDDRTIKAGTHSMTIGLSELASNSSLSNLNVMLIGENNKNDNTNLLDNYMSELSVDTSFASVCDLALNASLTNATNYVDNGIAMVKSKGFGGMTITTNDHWSVVNKSFVFDGERRTYTTFADALKGELPIVGNDINPWVSIWKDAYDAAHPAA